MHRPNPPVAAWGRFGGLLTLWRVGEARANISRLDRASVAGWAAPRPSCQRVSEDFISKKTTDLHILEHSRLRLIGNSPIE